MGTIADKLTFLDGTKTAIREAIVAKGVDVTDTDTFRSYANKIAEIQTGGGGDATMFGAGFDFWVGELDTNGKLNYKTTPTELVFTGMKDIGDWCFAYRYYYKKNIQASLIFSDLEDVTGENALNYAFYQSGVTSVEFPKLTRVTGSNAMYNAFSYNANLTNIVLENLVEVSGEYAMVSCFSNCGKLTSVSLPNLTTISSQSGCLSLFSGCSYIVSADLRRLTTISGNSGASNMFFGNSQLKTINLNSLTSVTGNTAMTQMFKSNYQFAKIRFPSLVEVSNKAFSSSSSSDMFYSCTNLRQIHFRKDATSVIQSLYRYSNKWGATSATIYFDLIGTITVNGVNYSRHEYDSIYEGQTETYVAWKDADGNIVYTSFANEAEPAVDTVVYSDAGVTQVGTVSSVA